MRSAIAAVRNYSYISVLSLMCEKEDLKMTDIGFCRLSETADSSASVSNMARLLFGVVGILLLIYLLAELTPKLSGFIDKHFGGGKNDSPQPVDPKDYVVHDPYEGEIKEDSSEKINDENNGSDKADTAP